MAVSKISNDNLIFETVTGENVTIGAGSFVTTSISIPAHAGYTPVGVLAYDFGVARISASAIYITPDKTKVGMAIGNPSGSSVTAKPDKVVVMYAKTAANVFN